MVGKGSVKCSKCGIISKEDCSLTFHRFPLPSKHGSLKAKVWAKFCFPDGDWTSNESLEKLYAQHRMLCGNHFDDSSFTSSDRKRLNKFAIPSAAQSILSQLRDEQCSPSKASHVTNLQVVFEPRGLIPPVFTPLNEDLTVNYKEISSYADYMVVNGIKAVLVGGTTGEHMSLSVSDRKKIIEAWVKTKPRSGLHIMVQVGGAPMADVLELAKFCASANVDSLLTLPELYFKPKTVTELVNYVELVSKAAPNLPVLYYHIPSMSKVEINMPAFVTEATSKIPNFKGIKFTSNDLSEGVQVKRNLKEDQEVFLGADTLLAPAALLGIKSSIGTSFNLFPKLAQNILGAVENGDVKKANSLQRTLSLAIEAHLPEGDWVPIMKFGMEIASGLTMGPPALPQQPISTESRNRIVARLKLLKMIE
ncbi:N-acetylneuraminate lyase-like isoform X2 [Pieris napi]|uniref:N-acetylneuraminate lyase-like isoform X2 n=1 Tax=Pieris napi TaxID=78633 RepID=UPI001FB92BB4|nr:N-acetylneuraminate lyase-like isoform X2 [Pieris napi]